MKTIHFSIDDVTLTNDLMLEHLITWHKKIGLKATLYCYSDNLAKTPRTQFLSKNASWLKLGFHSKNNLAFADDKDYKKSFASAQKDFKRLQCGTTEKIRLHYWNVTSDQAMFLAHNGVRMLFTKEISGIDKTYSLQYCPTDVRFESIDITTKETLCIGKSHIVAFTHEWCFRENVHKIEDALRIYKKSGYEFSV